MGNFPDSGDSRLSNSLDFSTLERLSKATFDSRATFDSLDFGDFPNSGDSPHVGGSPFVVPRSPCRRNPVPAPDRPRSPVAAFPGEWVQIYHAPRFARCGAFMGVSEGRAGCVPVVRARRMAVFAPNLPRVAFCGVYGVCVPPHNKARYRAILSLCGGRTEYGHKKTPPRRAGIMLE